MRVPDRIAALLLTLITLATLLWPRPVGPDDLTLRIEQRPTQGRPPLTPPGALTLHATWAWSNGAPSTTGRDYLLVVADAEGWYPNRGYTGLSTDLLIRLGVHGKVWAFPVEPGPSGERLIEVWPSGSMMGTELPLRVYYLHRGRGLQGSTWTREVPAIFPIK